MPQGILQHNHLTIESLAINKQSIKRVTTQSNNSPTPSGLKVEINACLLAIIGSPIYLKSAIMNDRMELFKII